MIQGLIKSITNLMGIIFGVIPFILISIGFLAFLAIIIYIFTGYIGLTIAVILFIWSVIKNRKRR